MTKFSTDAHRARAPVLVKRAVDALVAAILLLVLLPVEATIAVAVRLTLGKPILFVQERPGLHEVPFRMLKFRTMTLDRGQDDALLPDAQRLTRLGRVLRANSLDELPQLLNVVAGDMSLIGPRPLLMRYLPYFDARERLRFSVRPGITGWAQVNGRNTVAWDDRLALDAWYVEKWSLLLDLRIALLTVRVVVRRKGFEEEDAVANMTNLDHVRHRQVPEE
jgi:sugar transferase EpsL